MHYFHHFVIGFFKTIVLIGYVNCVFMFSPLFSYVGFVYIAPVRGKCSLFFFYLLVKEEDMFPPIFTFLYIPYVLFVIYFHYLFFTYTTTMVDHNKCSVFEYRSWQGVLDTTLCDKVCQWQVDGFLRVVRFPPPIKLTATI